MRSEERDRHTIHRLEAFSDIVIGFCLAQVGVNFALLKTSSDLTSLWANAEFFLVSFFIISVLWWFHHRTFSTFFVLMPLTIGLNFALLASLVLSIYFMQSFLHATTSGYDAILFLRLWIGSYLVLYTLLGALMLTGMIIRRGALGAPDLRWGVQRLVIIALSVLLLGCVVFSGIAASHRVNLAYAALTAGVAVIVFGRIILPRVLNRIIPDV